MAAAAIKSEFAVVYVVVTVTAPATAAYGLHFLE